MTHSAELKNECENVVTATLVAQKDRGMFFPKHLGMSRLLTGENTFYHFMDKLVPDYKGGNWTFYNLSNGGFYIAPSFRHAHLQSMNGSKVLVTGDAAGVIVTLFVLNYWLNQYEEINDEAGEKLYHQYYSLLDFASGHPESVNIFRAID